MKLASGWRSMPITRRQFELGIDDSMAEIMLKIHSYLAEHHDQAFTANEIFEGLSPELVRSLQGHLQAESIRIDLPPLLAVYVARGLFDDALEKLCQLGAVASRQIGSKKW